MIPLSTDLDKTENTKIVVKNGEIKNSSLQKLLGY